LAAAVAATLSEDCGAVDTLGEGAREEAGQMRRHLNCVKERQAIELLIQIESAICPDLQIDIQRFREQGCHHFRFSGNEERYAQS
jgi:hypothetical protein